MATFAAAQLQPAEERAPLTERIFPNNEWVLLLVILLECVVFSAEGHNFATLGNAFEITRLAVEIGLLALALTPIIVTGGIDLSVGSMMGLAAIVLGYLWHDAGLPMVVAIAMTLMVGLVGGALNAVLIARLKFPPLIVTLGTLSLFRGIAEGLTGGIQHYSGFPAAFLALGQGYVGGLIPTQLFILVAAAVGAAWWLHRTSVGRALYAIGHSPEGARFAGIPVSRRLASVYVLSGFASSLAAVIYVAHLGQAKSDAGTGYELMAITAVVLGGASIFGGRGTILGTMLGLFSIVLLQNGLRLTGQPAELAGILTGGLLIGTITVDMLTRQSKTKPTLTIATEQDEVRNSQVGFLSAVILAGALIVAASNWMLVQSLRGSVGGVAQSSMPQAGASGMATGTTAAGAQPSAHRPVVAMMPKAKGDPYFISARKGADSAASALGVELLWDGPTDLDPAKQNEIVEAWITRGVDAIAVSVENKEAISTVLRKARAKGIKVVTWDADAEKDARDFFVNQATPQGIGYTLMDEAARITGGKGEFAIITASLSAANQNEWIKYIKERLAAKYPGMTLVAIQPSEGDRDRAFSETQTVLKVHPKVKLIMAIAAPAVPGAAEAVKQSGRTDVKVTGLSLPNMCRAYIKSGVIESIVLWNTMDLGALAVRAAEALTTGELKPGATSLDAGKLGTFEVVGDEVRLGKPFIFNKSNIDRFSF
ncbi:MAG: substrate-binding domain-containing protein [Gemmatimonadota bacterium]|nr:substrate-binding domain-containing protein [Gemmatimonadota bacterium]